MDNDHLFCFGPPAQLGDGPALYMRPEDPAGMIRFRDTGNVCRVADMPRTSTAAYVCSTRHTRSTSCQPTWRGRCASALLRSPLMTDLFTFLSAHLDEDERGARAVHDNSAPFDGQWTYVGGPEYGGDVELQTDNGRSLAVLPGGRTFKPGLLPHIVRHDPARVLADVAAKRGILDLHAPRDPRPPKTDAELHAEMAHPEWEYAITEGQRKQFDAGDPPDPDQYGTGWEVNTDKGDDGWERFRFTEEAYWRRRRETPLPPAPTLCGHCRKRSPCQTIRLLGLPYVDDPEYRQEWRP